MQILIYITVTLLTILILSSVNVHISNTEIDKHKEIEKLQEEINNLKSQLAFYEQAIPEIRKYYKNKK